MDIYSYDTSNHVVCMCVLGWRPQQKVYSEVTHKDAETCLPDDLISLTPIDEFLLAKAVEGSYRITVSELWHVNPVGSFGKTKSHVDVLMRLEDSFLYCKCQLTK